MTHVTCRLTAKNRHQLRNPTVGNRAWATFLPLPVGAQEGRCRRRGGGKCPVTAHLKCLVIQGVDISAQHASGKHRPNTLPPASSASSLNSCRLNYAVCCTVHPRAASKSRRTQHWRLGTDSFGPRRTRAGDVLGQNICGGGPPPSSFPSLALEVGPLNTARSLGSAASSPSGVWGGPQRKSNFVPLSVKVRHLVESDLLIFLRISWPRCVKSTAGFGGVATIWGPAKFWGPSHDLGGGSAPVPAPVWNRQWTCGCFALCRLCFPTARLKRRSDHFVQSGTGMTQVPYFVAVITADWEECKLTSIRINSA